MNKNEKADRVSAFLHFLKFTEGCIKFQRVGNDRSTERS